MRWLNTVAQAATADLGALIQVVGQLPNQTLALRELAVDLTQQIGGRLRVIADLKKGCERLGADQASGQRRPLQTTHPCPPAAR